MKRKPPSILVAVDGSDYSDKAFKYACALSLSKKIPLLIINVVEHHATIGYSILRELKNSSKEMLQEYKTRAKSMGVMSASTILAVGNATEEILKITNKEKIDSLVIGSRGRYGTPKDILGGTSYKLAHYSNCTVIIVR